MEDGRVLCHTNPDANLWQVVERRRVHTHEREKVYRQSIFQHSVQFHASLIQKLRLESLLEGHEGCVNTLSWNSSGSHLLSGSDDRTLILWDYPTLTHRSVQTGHVANIFCAKFIPESGDDVLASAAGDGEVRVHRLSRASGRRNRQQPLEGTSAFLCHSHRRVKKLAVEEGNRNLLWSAGEDGTVRQHDLRESHLCHLAHSSGRELDCNNILLDLRRSVRKSLEAGTGGCLALKSMALNPVCPNYLLVGGSDCFGRLYDRRMLPSLSRTSVLPNCPPPVCYFAPFHLSQPGRPWLHLTHVTFSPSGQEVLLNYSGEHVYLMDAYLGGNDCTAVYQAGDSKLRYSLPASHAAIKAHSVGSSRQCCGSTLSKAKRYEQEGSQGSLLKAVELCSVVLDGGHHPPSDSNAVLRYDCLCVRASALIKRRWRNDSHMAMRDCREAYQLCPDSATAFFLMSQACFNAGMDQLALAYSSKALLLDPDNSAVGDMIHRVQDRMDRRGEEMRLAEEGMASSSPEGSRDSSSMGISDVLHQIQEAVEESDDDGDGNGDDDSASSWDSAKEEHESNDIAVDMRQRYVGHCNVGTDIKQASFLGDRGEFVAAGSDDGRLFIWEKSTGVLVKILIGDKNVVNCIQSHPSDSCIATSGIDETVKLWRPGAGTLPEAQGSESNFVQIMADNQSQMRRTRDIALPLELINRLRVEGQPIQCQTS